MIKYGKRLAAAAIVTALAFGAGACKVKPGASSSPAPASSTAQAAPDVQRSATAAGIPSPGENEHSGSECRLNYLPDGRKGLTLINGSHGAKVIIGTVVVSCVPPPLRHKLALTIYKQGAAYYQATKVGNATYDSAVNPADLPAPTIIKTVTALCSPGTFFLVAVATGVDSANKPLFSSGAGYSKSFSATDCQ